MAEPTEDNTVVLITVAPPPPFSHVKREDLRRVAQRMIDQHGFLRIKDLHKQACARIPGSLARYTSTVLTLMKSKKLKFPHKSKRSNRPS